MAKRMRCWGERKDFPFSSFDEKEQKSDSYSNYHTTRRDRSKREPSVEEVQCSSLGTEDSGPKQCCCLWPLMKTGWVVESPALGNSGAYSNLLFCSTILVRKHWICDLVCPLSDFYGRAQFKFKPPVGSTVCSSAQQKSSHEVRQTVLLPCNLELRSFLPHSWRQHLWQHLYLFVCLRADCLGGSGGGCV